MEKDAREQSMDRFYTVGEILSLQAGQAKRFTALTDFDRFEPIMAHRTPKGRVFCPYTTDPEGASCPLCAKGNPRVGLAAASIYNFSDKVRQIALLSGPKKGPLYQLKVIFNTVGTYLVLIEMIRQGSGQDTNYTLVSVSTDVQLPEGLEPFTKAEILEKVSGMLKERQGDSGW